MKVGFGSVVVTAGINGILSFCFLALAIGTEYWYIIDDSRNLTEPEHVHSGFWGVSEDEQPFSEAPSSLSESAKHMQRLLTLSGVSLYISYSQQALEETERRMGPEQMALVHTSFGWSMGMAWLSFILEVITGLLLLLAARMTQLTQYQETVAPI
ncbi:hypothetical protein NFI96_003292 [Prochilodus magdalenae]|nr:hypothetical protein NFI96_003292 [Prochilodus magdalenae]